LSLPIPIPYIRIHEYCTPYISQGRRGGGGFSALARRSQDRETLKGKKRKKKNLKIRVKSFFYLVCQSDMTDRVLFRRKERRGKLEV
jgi:hypothetical protein